MNRLIPKVARLIPNCATHPSPPYPNKTTSPLSPPYSRLGVLHYPPFLGPSFGVNLGTESVGLNRVGGSGGMNRVGCCAGLFSILAIDWSRGGGGGLRDGTRVIEFINGQKETTTTEGVKIREFPNGLVRRHFPDGRVESVHSSSLAPMPSA